MKADAISNPDLLSCHLCQSFSLFPIIFITMLIFNTRHRWTHTFLALISYENPSHRPPEWADGQDKGAAKVTKKEGI